MGASCGELWGQATPGMPWQAFEVLAGACSGHGVSPGQVTPGMPWQALNNTFDQLDLTDTLSTFQPKSAEYTFFSRIENVNFPG